MRSLSDVKKLSIDEIKRLREKYLLRIKEMDVIVHDNQLAEKLDNPDSFTMTPMHMFYLLCEQLDDETDGYDSFPDEAYAAWSDYEIKTFIPIVLDALAKNEMLSQYTFVGFEAVCLSGDALTHDMDERMGEFELDEYDWDDHPTTFELVEHLGKWSYDKVVVVDISKELSEVAEQHILDYGPNDESWYSGYGEAHGIKDGKFTAYLGVFERKDLANE